MPAFRGAELKKTLKDEKHQGERADEEGAAERKGSRTPGCSVPRVAPAIAVHVGTKKTTEEAKDIIP